ncbi:MAG: anti-sigma factor antagonist [Nitrospirae bacterium]|nr:MAG: anti-sigma factor antagonist [Nitrospirota bacterium]
MQVSERQEGDATIVKLEGRFDFANRRVFKDTIDRVQSSSSQRVILDLEGVSFVDSSALGLLVIAHQQFKTRQQRLSLAHPQPYVRQVLELANVPKMIPVYSTVREAVAAAGEAMTAVR